jgi:hypothetical protein
MPAGLAIDPGRLAAEASRYTAFQRKVVERAFRKLADAVLAAVGHG